MSSRIRHALVTLLPAVIAIVGDFARRW